MKNFLGLYSINVEINYYLTISLMEMSKQLYDQLICTREILSSKLEYDFT